MYERVASHIAVVSAGSMPMFSSVWRIILFGKVLKALRKSENIKAVSGYLSRITDRQNTFSSAAFKIGGLILGDMGKRLF